jgi:tetratricopeptide (TPR) repeat protein
MAMAPEQPAKLELFSQASAGPTTAFQAATGDLAPAIPDYELMRRVGRGAYGEVWLARNLTGSFVAVKVVARAAFEYDRPFEREFEGIKRFEPISRSNPAQVAILHVGRGDGFFYYVMELADDVENPKVEGRNPKEIRNPRPETPGSNGEIPPSGLYIPHTLREDLKRHGRLSAAQCVQIGLALARALAYLHKCGLVHRDVKPSNVIFVGGVPKLADIGLVASVDATRSLVGTEGYVAPEGPGTPQADLYSLGKLLYEISTGCDRKEFPALPLDIAARPDCEALIELNAIVTRACQFDPHQRYGNAEAMLAELELLQRGQSVQRTRRRWQRWLALKRLGIALAGLTALAAAIASLVRPVAPNPYPEGPPSTNMVANMLCEKGMLIIRGDNTAEFLLAYTNFHRAIELDPRYARPYVGLLELRLREYIPSLGLASPEEMLTIAQQLRKLAPNLAATHCAQSVVNWDEWNYLEALRSSLRAIKADPNYELAHSVYAFLLTMWGYPIEARAQLAISEALRPSKAMVYRVFGQSYYVQRDYTNAMAWERRALELNRYEAVAFYTIGCAYRAMGDYSNALDNLEQESICEGGDAPETRKHYAQLRQALREGGVRGYWQQQLKQTANWQFYSKAVAELHLGNTSVALRWLEKSCAAHEHWRGSHDGPLSYLLLDQDWDGLHNDPRFKAVLDKVGFTKVTPPRKR